MEYFSILKSILIEFISYAVEEGVLGSTPNYFTGGAEHPKLKAVLCNSRHVNFQKLVITIKILL